MGRICPEPKIIIEALRCSADTSGNQKCKGKICPYLTTSSDEEIEKFLKENNVKRSDFPDDFFEGCDIDQIALDAADLLEKLEDDGK